MKTKTIRQSIIFSVHSREIYETLMNSRKHSQSSDSKAVISKEKGGRFSAYDGYINGVNLELIPNKIIVQSLRASDWTERHYSKVIFALTDLEQGTRLDFTQTGVPSQFYDDISRGWYDFYWNPMKSMLEK